VPHEGAPFTQLGVQARYRPPLGPLGAIGDRLLGAEVVDASLTTFLEDLAAAVTDHVIAPSLTPEPDDGEAAAPEAGPETKRVFLTVDGLAVRPGGAVAAVGALAAIPGVIHVSLDPFADLAAVDHDPERCSPGQMQAALEEQAPAKNRHGGAPCSS
jgi:hypothetical protein